MVDEEEEVKAVIAKATKSGLGNYDPVPMNCGDCAFTTHYENELFEHLKAHLRKDANIQVMRHIFSPKNIFIVTIIAGCKQGGEAEEAGRDHEQRGGSDDLRGGRLPPLRHLRLLQQEQEEHAQAQQHRPWSGHQRQGEIIVISLF